MKEQAYIIARLGQYIIRYRASISFWVILGCSESVALDPPILQLHEVAIIYVVVFTGIRLPVRENSA